MIKRSLIKFLLKLLYPSYSSDSDPNPAYVLKLGFYQKVLGINRSVHWPVHFTSQVKEARKLAFKNTRPGSAIGCYLDARNGIELDENVIIGPRVSIISMNHETSDFSAYKQEGPVIIRQNSWLGAGSIILPGVHLGEHTVVAAGAVVTKSFTEGDVVIAGNPAKIIKELPPYKS